MSTSVYMELYKIADYVESCGLSEDARLIRRCTKVIGELKAALEHHQDQTRPIQATIDVLEKYSAKVGEGGWA